MLSWSARLYFAAAARCAAISSAWLVHSFSIGKLEPNISLSLPKIVDRVVVDQARSAPGRCGARRCRDPTAWHRGSAPGAEVRRPPSKPPTLPDHHRSACRQWVRMKVVSGFSPTSWQTVLHLRGEKLQVEGQAIILQPARHWRAPWGRSPDRPTARSGRRAFRASAVACARRAAADISSAGRAAA